MFDPPAWLWIACTIAAAAVQTLRNAMQRSLTERVGTVGATHAEKSTSDRVGQLNAVSSNGNDAGLHVTEAIEEGE